MIRNKDGRFLVPIEYSTDEYGRIGDFAKVPFVTAKDAYQDGSGNYWKKWLFPYHCGDWHDHAVGYTYPTDPNDLTSGFRSSRVCPVGGISFRPASSTDIMTVEWSANSSTTEDNFIAPTTIYHLNCGRSIFGGKNCYLISPQTALAEGVMLSGRFKESNVAQITKYDKYGYYEKYDREFVLRLPIVSPTLRINFWYCIRHSWDNMGGGHIAGFRPVRSAINNGVSLQLSEDFSEVETNQQWKRIHYSNLGSRGTEYLIVNTFQNIGNKIDGLDLGWVSFPKICFPPLSNKYANTLFESLTIEACGCSFFDLNGDITDNNWEWKNVVKPTY